ncbi:MAG: hypothetical protein H6632_21480 [Anaerolineales bacterium]|nr:hypothetical protein [Anaerolineales bacterium]
MLETIDLSKKLKRKEYRQALDEYQTKVRALGFEVYRQQRPVVMVFEGWDAAGKGGAIKRLTARLDPRSYEVHAIAAPTGDDAARHYLYRFWRRLPIQGEIGIFDRTWYGRVLVERVEGFCSTKEWQRAYGEINEFEKQLVDFGTIIFKFWVHISKDEQLARFESRRMTPQKSWKLTEEDWRNRKKWDEYEAAVEDMIAKTSTEHAPWTVVPGNDKGYARITVLKTVVEGLSRSLNFDPSPENLAKLPPVAAPTPIPDWAKKEAKGYGIKV